MQAGSLQRSQALTTRRKQMRKSKGWSVQSALKPPVSNDILVSHTPYRFHPHPTQQYPPGAQAFNAQTNGSIIVQHFSLTPSHLLPNLHCWPVHHLGISQGSSGSQGCGTGKSPVHGVGCEEDQAGSSLARPDLSW